jgi:hypothetical protein
MQKFPWFPRVKNDLIAWLVLLGLITLLGSVAAQAPSPWLSDFLLNLGASFLTFVVAVVLVDEVVRNHERKLAQAERDAQQRIEDERWIPVSHHIGFYVQRVAHRCALAYRIAVGIGDDDLPHDKIGPEVPEMERLKAVEVWIEETIIPALPNLERRSRDEWRSMFRTLRRADGDAREALLLYGDRLKPDIFEQLIDIRRSIALAFYSYEIYEPVLGVSDALVEITPDMRINDVLLIGQKHGKTRLESIRTAREIGVEDAAEEAENVLRSAVRLLEVTMPLLPTESRSPSET